MFEISQIAFPSIVVHETKVHKTHDPFTTLISSKVLSTLSHTSFNNTKNVQLMNLVG